MPHWLGVWCRGLKPGQTYYRLGCLGRPWLFRDLADVFAGLDELGLIGPDPENPTEEDGEAD